MKRKLIIFIAILVLLFMQALPVCASDMEEPGGTYVEVLFPYMGLQFELYKVASLNSSGGYTPTADFQDCPVDFNNLTGKAEILESYVHLWGMEPMATNTVGWGDFAYFEEVGSGAYLLMSRLITTGGKTYKAQPLTFYLPVRDAESGEVIQSLTVSPKPVIAPPYSEETISRKVIKVWENLDPSLPAPESVTVYLICNGGIYDEQVLSAENNWTYQWDDLETHNVWSVTEEPVENFHMDVQRTGSTYVVTNTYQLPHKPTEPPTEPETEPSTEPSTEPETEEPDDTPKLPQTGLLWWPVPVLAGGGMVLFTIGWFLNRREEDE